MFLRWWAIILYTIRKFASSINTTITAAVTSTSTANKSAATYTDNTTAAFISITTVTYALNLRFET